MTLDMARALAAYQELYGEPPRSKRERWFVAHGVDIWNPPPYGGLSDLAVDAGRFSIAASNTRVAIATDDACLNFSRSEACVIRAWLNLWLGADDADEGTGEGVEIP